ncbi:UDP-N-acetylmuramoyl-L-alanine--D-glutamate ligase [Ichthyobacterium seriolicida]|uniref:UDP-N-acetylmuramoylalanine--D-glutamate ligase n=1 Tax=Ichthyobacterium seriolicida TaxID=242600 RepID=A0A1J1DZA8_9FLAO|nr:UDP-N-acetylmuramoyl-L-alanine--D-glutamate ligase [Ichthyobacterium seriolicida]BAV95255.1 UDP-N-acetylmuramoylalanine--D-glutamate ligase [Ichthyobacterium seriolicida]
MKGLIVVLGGAESGVGAAVLAKSKGFEVFLSDCRVIKEKYKLILNRENISFEQLKHSEEIILSAAEIIKSPGIPDDIDILNKARNKGIKIISEIEFAYRYTNAQIIAVTGSNGKTTTTLLIYEILKSAGLNVCMAGNIGSSFALRVAEGDFDFYVLELSSFQLDGIVEFRPEIAVLLNIVPDHLDRYDYDIENYIKSKFRILKNQSEHDYFLYYKEDEIIKDYMRSIEIDAKTIPFSATDIVDGGIGISKGDMIFNYGELYFKMALNSMALKGIHNICNSMAASVCAKILNVQDRYIKHTLEHFSSVEHRFERVLEINGVEYINDSKATNVNSTFFALENISRPIIWIVGGQDKGNDYTELIPLVKKKVKAMICLGVDNSKIIDIFKNKTEYIFQTKSMTEAVGLANEIAVLGDTVILSPTCASFDLFENYEDRGNRFKEAVKNIQ